MVDKKQPTAANILSSLGVKGAISGLPAGADASKYENFVPMLDKNGKLSVDFIPSSAVEQVVKPISNVAIVDPSTTVEDGNRTGSAVAPFKTLHEAAQKVGFDSAGRCAVILMPGKYSGNENAYMDFRGLGKFVAIIGIGTCEISSGAFNIYGLAGGKVFLQDISTNNNIQVYYSSEVYCLGRTYVGGTLSVGEITLKLSPEARVVSTDARAVQYLSDTDHIGNASNVPGETVSKALNRLHSRKIRIAKASAGDSGIDIGSSSYEDVSAESDGSLDVFDLREHDKELIKGINNLSKGMKNLVSETITAGRIVADEIQVKSLKMNALTLGGYKLGIDTYGYLVILDGGSDITPPSGVILIEDTGSSGNGEIYALSVSNGRLYIGEDTGSSSSQEILRQFTITDSRTGEEYVVTCANGRLEIEGVLGSGDSTPSYAPRLYAIDEETGKYHLVTAVTANGKTTLVVNQDGISDVQLAAIQSA